MTSRSTGHRAALIVGALAVPIAAPASAQQAIGTWHGDLSIGAISLRIGVDIVAAADGTLSGSLVSPDQGPQRVALGEILFAGTTLSFTAPQIGGRFAARWDPARQAWAGTWTQNAALPLVLLPGKVAALVRPQEPKPPYPYREEEVAIDSAPGVRLAGTLTIPPGPGPFPAVVLITGSGPQNRDEELLGHKPFLVLADHLARRGIAVLRCDDRGTARSTGQFATATSQDFAVDAAAAVAWLRGHAGMNPARIGVIGHSEGGVIGPMVAQMDPKLAFVVMLAGPGVRGDAVTTAQSQAIGRTLGLPAATIARNVAMLEQANAAVIAARDPEDAKATLTRILTAAGLPGEAVAAQVRQMATPWYKLFVAYDPAPALARLRIPLLVLNGSTDTQVIASQNLPAIRAATAADADVTIVELPGLNHLFQTSASGSPRDYGTIEETISPAALTLIGDWIVKHG